MGEESRGPEVGYEHEQSNVVARDARNATWGLLVPDKAGNLALIAAGRAGQASAKRTCEQGSGVQGWAGAWSVGQMTGPGPGPLQSARRGQDGERGYSSWKLLNRPNFDLANLRNNYKTSSYSQQRLQPPAHLLRGPCLTAHHPPLLSCPRATLFSATAPSCPPRCRPLPDKSGPRRPRLRLCASCAGGRTARRPAPTPGPSRTCVSTATPRSSSRASPESRERECLVPGLSLFV